MPENIARERFLEATRGRDEAIDLAEVCFWISAEANPVLDVECCRQKLDALADELRPRLSTAESVSEKVSLINHFLFAEQKFCGNRGDYYDADNSYLDCVLERRTGIPITLSVLWLAVAERLELPAHGIGFPGHFLIGVAADPPIYVDAFSGICMSVEDCRTRLREIAGREARFDPGMLAPATHRQILARVLRNLKQVHAQGSNYRQAVACIDRILILEPDHPIELRDRGLMHRALECWSSAHEDLERFLLLAPDGPGASDVRIVLNDLDMRIAHIH
ncbi:MAG: tetratricopeptide repeat protein [Deltaproteobacteria bacterium]|nr:tetratricopeptide repeat protein [Deltaproteobacteria bacterium]